MSPDELKELAKTLNIKTGNMGRDKLIDKIKEARNETNTIDNIINDDDLNTQKTTSYVNTQKESPSDNSGSLLAGISDAIDDLDESDSESKDISTEDLPIDTLIAVKSVTFGGLTYISRTNNAVFRWNRIGAVEYMTVAELNEMNNHKRDFLNKPLVILLNEKAVKKFRLTRVYENVAKINDLKKILSSDISVIKRTIDIALDVNMRDILISKISQMIKNKTLVNINVIRLLSEKLKHDFDDMID